MYQKVIAGIILVLGACFMVNVCFYCVNYRIINFFKAKVNDKILEVEKEKQS